MAEEHGSSGIYFPKKEDRPKTKPTTGGGYDGGDDDIAIFGEGYDDPVIPEAIDDEPTTGGGNNGVNDDSDDEYEGGYGDGYEDPAIFPGPAATGDSNIKVTIISGNDGSDDDIAIFGEGDDDPAIGSGGGDGNSNTKPTTGGGNDGPVIQTTTGGGSGGHEKK
ncbi:uncharacterized protein LOC131642272 [Vicia villosa]|uniref:uncharacterized protein LOC131642272 n=1 Tax=Vicia villosa TaxID=3911 RepID=UPI00273C8E73|nr:uncharacterized protein LOC131642272 [Vicia villosa]